MTKSVANPTRLSRLPESEDALGVGRLFRNGRDLPEEDLPKLRWRLRTSQRMRAIRPRLFLKVALTVGLAFCMGGVVGAGVWPYWPKKDPATVEPSRTVVPTAKRAKARPAAPVAPAPVETVHTEPNPAIDVSDLEAKASPGGPKTDAAPAKRRAGVHVASVKAPTPPPEPVQAPGLSPEPAAASPIAVEQAMVGQAVRLLRDGHDARAALAVLSQHAERFPSGALAAEGNMVRIEALLGLGQKDEALLLLDRASLGSLPNQGEQLVVRGELRAAKGRWREAKQDFDEVLRVHALPSARTKVRGLQERALWGRASARSRLGDADGARADLDLYVRHFPGGHFAGPATSLLKGTP